MDNKQDTEQRDYEFGKEILIKNSNGRFMFDGEVESLRTIDNLEETTLTGIYMAVQLQRLFVNIKLQNEPYDERIRTFTIAEVLFHNIWDYRLDTISSGSHKMIDSEGFQHTGDTHYYESSKVFLPGGKTFEASFLLPESELEGHSKTKGWLWFDSLSENVLPHRFMFQFSVYDPGTTSGWVKESETLEFIITDYDIKPIEEFIA
jgi:hypothetical protein